MQNGIYDILAGSYDNINSAVDHSAMADFFLEGCRRFSREIKTALDLCCGTGSMLIELAKRGVDMQGADVSPNMLSTARERIAKNGLTDVLLLCQDMREFELYGTVDAITCCLDSINHLNNTKELHKVFSLVKNYLEYGGIFYFDVNSAYKYENVYGNNSYIIEEDGLYCGWQNFYNKKSGVAEFVITVFEENADGTYTRSDALQKEKHFSHSVILKALKAAGLEFCGVYGNTDFSAPTKTDERLYYFAKRPEEASGR